MSGMEPGEIIAKARKDRGWSQKDLGNRVGITQVAVQKIERGGTNQSKFLPKIAQLLELDLSLLTPDLQSQTIPDAPLPPPLATNGRPNFPVYASAEGGPGEIIRSTDPVDFVPRPTHLMQVKDAYGLLITGTSMWPEYKPGEMAIVEPSLPTVAGEVYIFYSERDGEARATIKELRRANSEAWLVSQHNPPEGRAKDFSLPRTKWGVAHRVTGKLTRR